MSITRLQSDLASIQMQLAEITRDWKAWNEEHPYVSTGGHAKGVSAPKTPSPSLPKAAKVSSTRPATPKVSGVSTKTKSPGTKGTSSKPAKPASSGPRITGKNRSEVMISLGTAVDKLRQQHRGNPGALADAIDKVRESARARLAKIEGTKRNHQYAELVGMYTAMEQRARQIGLIR